MGNVISIALDVVCVQTCTDKQRDPLGINCSVQCAQQIGPIREQERQEEKEISFVHFFTQVRYCHVCHVKPLLRNSLNSSANYEETEFTVTGTQ